MRGLPLVIDPGGGRDLAIARARRAGDRPEYQRRAPSEMDRGDRGSSDRRGARLRAVRIAGKELRIRGCLTEIGDHDERHQRRCELHERPARLLQGRSSGPGSPRRRRQGPARSSAVGSYESSAIDRGRSTIQKPLSTHEYAFARETPALRSDGSSSEQGASARRLVVEEAEQLDETWSEPDRASAAWARRPVRPRLTAARDPSSKATEEGLLGTLGDLLETQRSGSPAQVTPVLAQTGATAPAERLTNDAQAVAVARPPHDHDLWPQDPDSRSTPDSGSLERRWPLDKLLAICFHASHGAGARSVWMRERRRDYEGTRRGH